MARSGKGMGLVHAGSLAVLEPAPQSNTKNIGGNAENSIGDASIGDSSSRWLGRLRSTAQRPRVDLQTPPVRANGRRYRCSGPRSGAMERCSGAERENFRGRLAIARAGIGARGVFGILSQAGNERGHVQSI